MMQTYRTTPTLSVEVNSSRYAYRKIGQEGGIPIIYLNHLAANLDNCDPLIMDTLAQHFTVISFDYKGVGASTGQVADSIEEMAQDTVAFIRAMGYEKVHLLGLSLGGFVTQEILRIAPELIARVILAGTGPKGDKGIERVARITYYDMFRAFWTRRDPRYYLFFPETSGAKALGQAFIARTNERRNRDEPIKIPVLLAQLRAVRASGKGEPQDFSEVNHRVWVVNGDNDRMLPTAGSYDLSERLPNATLIIYEGSWASVRYFREQTYSLVKQRPFI